MHQLGPVDPASTPILRPGRAQVVHGRAHCAHWRRVATAVAVSQLAPRPCRRSRAHAPGRLPLMPRVRLPAARLPVPHPSTLHPLAQRPAPSVVSWPPSWPCRVHAQAWPYRGLPCNTAQASSQYKLANCIATHSSPQPANIAIQFPP